jgi:alpha-L-rhamnosidase
MKHAFLIILLPLMILTGAGTFPGKKISTVKLTDLRTEMLTVPLGIDITAPRFSWQLNGSERSIQQVAYQVLVSSDLSKLDAGQGELWNSGKVLSDQSIHIAYAGRPLKSRTTCYWKVKTWTQNGESEWSEPAVFSMGLLGKADWKAKWTGLDKHFAWDSVTKMARLSARYFRKTFTASKEIKKATIYISGLGLYELYINGQKIGDQVLAPSPTEYTKVAKYNTFDVTSNIIKGRNAIGTILGNGRFFAMRQNYKPQKWHTFGYPKMLLQLELLFTDGTTQTVISDDSWKVTADGPIRTNNEYDGEEYDATKEMTGWNTTSFNDSKWLKAQLVKAPGGQVEAQMNENMKVMEVIHPVSIMKLADDRFIIDMGQNMVGWIKMKVKGKRTDQVKLRYAESLQPNGEIYTANLRDALVTDIYTLKGIGQETWAPRFVFHGFRYVELTNYPGTPQVDDFNGEVVYDDMRTTGTLETSDPIINQLHKNAYWGIRGNYKGMPIDCPQRNERQPWLGDRATGAYGESFIFENSKLYAKWLDDIQESQTAEGSIPDVAPNFWYYYKDNMTWPGTYLTVSNMLYNQFGDKRPIIKHYPSMKKWLTYMKSKYMINYIISKDSYGDWCVPPESPELIHTKDSTRITDPALLATAYYCYILHLMQRFAGIVNKPEDAKSFAAEELKVKQAFNKKFYNRTKNSYGNNTVTANILPLAFNIVPESDAQKVFGNIVEKILVENRGHISTGVIGTQWLMRWLTYYGRADIAFQLATNTSYPGWGFMVKNGATTIWELWNGNTANPAMNSQNHVMLLGDLVVWFYENLAGIKSDPDHPGFKKIIMKPSFVDGLTYVNASYQSMYGKIKSHWKRNGNNLTWEISIPPNTTAEVFIPAGAAEDVKERAGQGKGLKFIRMDGDRAVFELGSGDFTLNTTTLKKA